MDVSRLCLPLEREAYCHVPGDSPFDVDRLVSRDEPERWSDAGEPTVYLAGDVGVALAELGRHTSDGQPGSDGERRRLVRVSVRLEHVLDLTRADTVATLGIEGAPWVYIDPARARALARRIRAAGRCEGMVVPSVAFLDRPDRWNLVIFAERLDGGIRDAVGNARDVGEVVLRD